MKRDKDKVEDFTEMLVSRGDAKKLLSEVINTGKRLYRRRTPTDLRDGTPEVQEFVKELKAWGKQSTKIMTVCFGENGTRAARARQLSYTTLASAKEKVQRKLTLLDEALKQANKLKKTPTKSTKKVRSNSLKLGSSSATVIKRNRRTYKYDFCLSFAGEDRAEARELNKLLKNRGAQVFYDFDPKQKHTLWGANLVTALDSIYQHESRYCIMFTSAAYVEKMWPKHERKAAQARELVQEGYILPIKLDDAVVPGSPDIIGFKDRRKDKRVEIADAAIEKLKKAHPRLKRSSQPTRAARNTKPRTEKLPTKMPRGALIMLGNDFYHAIRYHETGGTVTITVQVRDNAEKERLQQLERHPYGHSTNTLPFAYKTGSGRLRIQKLEYTDEAGRSLVTLSGQREALGRGRTASSQDEEAVSRQVRWVMFGEVLPQHERYALTHFNLEIEEVLKKGVLKQLWKDWQRSRNEFAEGARLLLTFLLSDLGILDRITLLKVGPWHQQNLLLTLKGVRDVPYTSSALSVDVSGELELPAKPRKK